MQALCSLLLALSLAAPPATASPPPGATPGTAGSSSPNSTTTTTSGTTTSSSPNSTSGTTASSSASAPSAAATASLANEGAEPAPLAEPPSPQAVAEPSLPATAGGQSPPPPVLASPSAASKPTDERRGVDFKTCMKERGQCYRFNVAGWTLATTGFASLAMGITFLAIPDQAIDDDPTSLRSYRSPGAVLTSLGGAALLTGLLLAFTGVALQQKKRKR